MWPAFRAYANCEPAREPEVRVVPRDQSLLLGVRESRVGASRRTRRRCRHPAMPGPKPLAHKPQASKQLFCGDVECVAIERTSQTDGWCRSRSSWLR